MPTLTDTSIQRMKLLDLTMEQWKELKKMLFQTMKFPMKEDIGKVEFGSTVSEWQTGVFEWEFKIDHNAKPEIGVLDFGIRRRPFDAPKTNIELAIQSFAEQNNLEWGK